MSDFAQHSHLVAGAEAAPAKGFSQVIAKSSRTITQSTLYQNSLWTLGGFPAAGVAPTTWSHPTSNTVGAWNRDQRYNAADGSKLRIIQVELSLSFLHNIVFADRVGHMAGLNANSTLLQAINATLTAPAADGRCAADGSDVQWYAEIYAGLGTTGVNFSFAVTYADNTTGSIILIGLASQTVPAIFPIRSSNGKYIKSVDSVTLSGNTGAVGNFGVTAYKDLFHFAAPIANVKRQLGWGLVGLPDVGQNACLCPYLYLGPSATASGSITGSILAGVM